MRVCKLGGRIALSAWTSDGFTGQLFKLIGQYNPPPPNNPPPPAPWTDEAVVRERLGKHITELHITPCMCPFIYPFDVSEAVALFRQYNGPITKAFERLDAARQMALQQDMENLFSQHNQVRDGTTHIDAAYVEIVAWR